MASKSDKTKQYIIHKIGPLFNKNGYSGTSLSDITKSTGLTKGAIYGNFKDKESLALDVFNYNVRTMLGHIIPRLQHIESPLAKLFGLTNFYRNYYNKVIDFGGCPLLNLSVETNNTNSKLFKRSKEIITKLVNNISITIEEGKACGEMREEIDAQKYAGIIFSLIEGSIFSSMMMKDDTYLINMMNHLDRMINREIKK